jgi:hypothetical protein
MADNPLNTNDASTPRVDSWIIKLLTTTPQLKAIYEQVRDPKTGKFLYTVDAIADMITSSTWYQENGPTVASNIASKAKFGDKWYEENVSDYKITISKIAKTIGLDVSDPTIAGELDDFADSAFLHGWDEAVMETKLISSDKLSSKLKGGAYATSVQEFAEYANLMGVKLSDKDRSAYQQRLLGTVDKNGFRVRSTADELKTELRAKVANSYPMFAEQLKTGATLWDLTSNYRQKTADLLEMDVDTVGWDDPLWKDGKIFTMTDPKTGAISQRPLWDVEKLIKADERWQYTENATKTYDNWGAKILNKFGMVAM